MDSFDPEAGNLREGSFLQTVLNHTDRVVLVFDGDGRLRWVNQAVRDCTDRPDTELESMPAAACFETLVVAADRERAGAAIDRLLERGTLTVELSLRGDDGADVPFEFRGSSAPVSDGTGYVLFGYEISDRLERERKVEQLQKLHAGTDADSKPLGVRDRRGDGFQRDYRGAVERRVLPRY